MVPLMVCSLLAAGQPPSEKTKPEVVAEFLSQALVVSDRKPDDLQAALANHPDVQIAEAKLRVAQAELAKTKLLVAQQVTAAKAKVSAFRGEAERAEQEAARLKKLGDARSAPAAEVQQAAARVAHAKAALAAAEADLRAALGTPPAESRSVVVDFTARDLLAVRGGTISFTPDAPAATPAGTAADKLRAALAANVKLDLPEGAKLPAVTAALATALAPHGLTLSAPPVGPADEQVTAGPFRGERPLAQWLQTVADSVSGRSVAVPTGQSVGATGRTQTSHTYMDTGRREFYVRDYGLLFTATANAPPGAETVGQFLARAARTAPAVSPELRDKLRAVLAMSVKRQGPPSNVGPFLRDLFEAAGTDLTVQAPSPLGDVTFIVPAGERTVGAWLQAVQDQIGQGGPPGGQLTYFVRDYGLLLCRQGEAPPGAVPLAAVK
jgi:hypothetical protein